MTFDYRDPDGDSLIVTNSKTDASQPVVWMATSPDGVNIDPARVEEVVAGIRDAARTASGQQPETTPCGGPVACGDEPCDRHEREQAHAEGEHALCGNECTCTCDSAGPEFVPAGHYRDCPQYDEVAPAVGQPAEAQATDLLAACATEYQVPVPEGGGTTLQVRRQSLTHGTGWAVSTRAYGGGRAWTTEGWQESISALSVDRLFCWPDATTAVAEARRALAVEDETR